MTITDALIDGAVLGDKDAQWKVCKGMQGAIKKLAESFCKQRPDLDMDDLIQEGYLCVLRCCDGYVSKDRKAKFSTYAFRAILNTFILVSDRTWRQRLCGYGTCLVPEAGMNEESSRSQGVEMPSESEESAGSRSQGAIDEMIGLGFTELEIHVMMARDGGDRASRALLTFAQIGGMLKISEREAQDTYKSAILKADEIKNATLRHGCEAGRLHG